MEAPQHTSSNASRLISWPDVQRLTSISRTTAWRFERRGYFPARVSITSGRVAWREAEIPEWINQRNVFAAST